MGVFAFFSYSARSVEVSTASIEQKATDEAQIPESFKPNNAALEPAATVAKAEMLDTPNATVATKEKDSSLAASASKISQAIPKIVVSKPSKTDSVLRDTDSVSKSPASKPHPQANVRRFSLRVFSLSARSPTEQHKPALSTVHEHEKKFNAAAAFAKRAKPRFSFSKKRAQESALIARSLIVGPSGASTKVTRANAKPQLNKLKSQLVTPKSANKVIAQLRALPISDDLAHGKVESADAATHLGHAHGPIHAVCLEYSDAEEDKLHFAPLNETVVEGKRSMSYVGGSASVEQVTLMFSEMNVVDLVRTPDLGLGQPGDGKGILAGAVPTAETVLKGVKEITPQLMALGYATGRTVAPNHAGTSAR
ncbi:hypothetical protein DXG03_006721 [Asterophora parasitica]|uniref:Uncharacterized protein n=1 Tax=Asterophora parasitica TaxID=117018 RepID=A0A9P7G801_9AGAR|nr:hypothetical protein DXG03_006721 [Asterophora parasitica]